MKSRGVLSKKIPTSVFTELSNNLKIKNYFPTKMINKGKCT